ncbi:MAG: hypothetical protein B7Z16_14650, partial [Algoriphagus sp. 32-45-6]
MTLHYDFELPKRTGAKPTTTPSNPHMQLDQQPKDRKLVDELIQRKQVALGMTSQEVQASLGKPSRKSSKITAAGKQERLEYRDRMRAARTLQEQEQIRNQHHEQMQSRAKER